MILELNGKKFDIDFFEVGTLERYQEAANNLEATSISTENNIELIKNCCNATYAFFDTLLGEGEAAKIFDGKYSFKTCTECLNTCVSECTNYLMNDFVKELNHIMSSWKDLIK